MSWVSRTRGHVRHCHPVPLVRLLPRGRAPGRGVAPSALPKARARRGSEMTAEHIPLCRAGDSLPWPAVCKPMLPLPLTHLPSFKRFFPVRGAGPEPTSSPDMQGNRGSEEPKETPTTGGRLSRGQSSEVPPGRFTRPSASETVLLAEGPRAPPWSCLVRVFVIRN